RDDDHQDCRVTSADKCRDRGGVAMGKGSCMPNPCASTPPPSTIRCCIPESDDDEHDNGDVECKVRTADQCAKAGGTNIGAGSCDDDACAPAPPPGDTRCCLVDEGDDDEHDGKSTVKCEIRSPAKCAKKGG